jgi:hypothetical protein
MSLTLSDLVIPSFVGALSSLRATIDAAERHAAAHDLDPRVLLDARLYPDMFSFTRQVQAASDTARRGIARLAGVEAERVEDNETSFGELAARVEMSLARVRGADRAAIDASAARVFQAPLGPGAQREFTGRSYITGFALPNLLFHVTTAYGIMRHSGVVLGKRDFLGPFIAAG